MSRQPYLRVTSYKVETGIDVGVNAIGQRPELEKLIGDCLIAWPHVEAETALYLGQLLGVENPAVLAVYQALRRSSAQREAISEAGKVSLDAPNQELLSAVLNVHKIIETERNALAHGHFGISSAIPDGVIWMNTNDYVETRLWLDKTRPTWDDDANSKKRLLSRVWVYRADDLKRIFDDIMELAGIWFDLKNYAALPDGSTRVEQYRQLCGQMHIAQELEILRREKTPPVQP